MYFKPILTSILLEFFNQQFILFTFTKKEGNGLSISEFDIESIATPTTSATTKNCVRDLLDFFQWDPATAETQRHMNIEEATVNMEGRKERTTTTSRDCPSSQDKEKTEKKSNKTSTYRIGAYSIIFLNSNTLPFILYFISIHFSLSMIKGLARPSPV